MEKFFLTAQPRTELGKQNLALRDNRMIPAVLYGHGIDNQNLSVSDSDFRKVFAKAEQSGLIELTIGSAKPTMVIVHDLQRDPLTQEVSHIDFYQVKMDEKLTATVSLEFVGESRAEKELGANIVKSHDDVEIECLPTNLVQHLTVDLSMLNEIGDAIRYSDIKLPDGIDLVSEPDTVIVSVQEAKQVEEETPAEEVSVENVEVEKKGKKEEETEPTEEAKSE